MSQRVRSVSIGHSLLRVYYNLLQGNFNRLRYNAVLRREPFVTVHDGALQPEWASRASWAGRAGSEWPRLAWPGRQCPGWAGRAFDVTKFHGFAQFSKDFMDLIWVGASQPVADLGWLAAGWLAGLAGLGASDGIILIVLYSFFQTVS